MQGIHISNILFMKCQRHLGACYQRKRCRQPRIFLCGSIPDCGDEERPIAADAGKGKECESSTPFGFVGSLRRGRLTTDRPMLTHRLLKSRLQNLQRRSSAEATQATSAARIKVSNCDRERAAWSTVNEPGTTTPCTASSTTELPDTFVPSVKRLCK